MAGRNQDDTNDRLSPWRGKPIMFFGGANYLCPEMKATSAHEEQY